MSEEADKRLVIGATAKVKGLKGAPEHNGCIGQLLEFVEEKGRWQIKLSNNGLVLGVKPANLDFVRAPEPDVDDQDDMEGALMQRTKRKFDRIVKKYNLFSEDKAGEIADLLTGSDESVSRISSVDFAAKYGMQEEEAETFLRWIQMGVKFKEEAIDPHNDASQGLAEKLNKM